MSTGSLALGSARPGIRALIGLVSPSRPKFTSSVYAVWPGTTGVGTGVGVAGVVLPPPPPPPPPPVLPAGLMPPPLEGAVDVEDVPVVVVVPLSVDLVVLGWLVWNGLRSLPTSRRERAGASPASTDASA